MRLRIYLKLSRIRDDWTPDGFRKKNTHRYTLAKGKEDIL
jgi:hypothetical protein